MIAGLNGVLEARARDSLIVSVGGVSYRVYVPTTTLSTVGAVGDPVRLFTHLHVREDALTLYGFQTPEERTLFELLLTVTGVGPKVALSLLSAYPAEMLQRAIAAGDLDLLSRVPGIGRKTAARLVVDLKGKLDLGRLTAAPVSPADAELMDALTNLGYTQAEAQAAIQSIPPDRAHSVEEKLRLALQYFVGRS